MDKAETWQAKRNKAVDLVAADIMPMVKVAEECGVRPRTFARWLEEPNFRVKVEIKRKAIAQRVLDRGVAVKVNRIRCANDRWDAMHRVIAARAIAPENAAAPGGTTGLLCHTLKGIGSGNAAQVVDEWEVDTGLLAEIRSHEEQVSKELGQWPLAAVGGGDTTINIAVLAASDSDVEACIEIAPTKR